MSDGEPPNEPARICFPFIGDTLGGSHFSALALARNLDPRRFDPVLVLHEDGRLAEHLRAERVAFETAPLPCYVRAVGNPLEPLASAARLAPRLIGFLRRRRIDLVHGNDALVCQTWLPATRLAGRPFVWHQRSRLVPSRLREALAARSDRLICVSAFARDTLPPRLKTTAQVLTNPFDVKAPAQDRAAARAAVLAAAGSEDRPIVGFCGSLTAQKRPGVFLEAAKLIAAEAHRRPLFALLGADRDGLLADLQRRAEALGLADDVAWLGYRTPAEFWLASFDLLLAPQVEDAFPRTFVEAMLAGTPIVGSRSGGHGEIVEHGVTGMLVTTDDPRAFADAALALLRDPARAAALAARAGAEARARFSIETHVKAMSALYAEALASPTRGTAGRLDRAR